MLMSRKAGGRKKIGIHDTGDPRMGSMDLTLYLYTFETTKKLLFKTRMNRF